MSDHPAAKLRATSAGATVDFQYERDGRIIGGGTFRIECVGENTVTFVHADEEWIIENDGTVKAYFDGLASAPNVVNIRVLSD